MAKWSIVFANLCLSIFSLHCISGCQSGSGGHSGVIFRNEKSMRMALKGTWILQEYADSIDAGLTPKLLEYMLEQRNCIKYDMNQLRTAGLHPTGPDVTNQDNNSAAYELNFDPGDNKVIMKITADGAIESDTGEFIAEDADTVLRLHRDSPKQDFVKYDNSKCPDISAYSHLVNSKFIAGKYFRLDDGGREHHIIFTKCGNVEGAEFIDATLRENTQYEVNLTNFYTDPDALEFYNPKYKMGRSFYWEVSQDSLILSRDNSFGEDRIVLIKAQ